MNKLRNIVVVVVIIGLVARVYRGNPERELASIISQLEDDLDASVDRLEGFVDDHPKHAGGWMVLGQAYLGQDRTRSAEEAFRRALDSEPDLADSLVGLAVSLRLQGEIDEACEHYEHAIRVDPNHANALSSLSVIYVIQKENKKAIQVAKKATELEPNNATYFANLCLVYHLDRDVEKRDQAAEEAERLNYSLMDSIREMIEEEPLGAVAREKPKSVTK